MRRDESDCRRFKYFWQYYENSMIISKSLFDEELKTQLSDVAVLQFTQKYLLHWIPFIFNENEGDYFNFRNRIANNFKVGFHEVFIVWSGKLGFSYSKNTVFTFNSDIDVVIVNSELFEQYSLEICNYQYQIDSLAKQENEQRQYNDFLQYMIKGWMRPDKLPYSLYPAKLKDDWFSFFKSISYGKSEVGNYKVNAGLFKNYNYLEKYYTMSVKKYRDSLLIN